MGLSGGCVAGVVLNRTRGEAVTPAGLEFGERNAVTVAIRAVELLLARDEVRS